ncbi:MAG: hypothetical protein KGH69_01145 [Candidatus Micrarchaeota archaeon]|nr:hypothetical protein [Candidatus Micrarchaeota archaeon]
MSLQGPTRTKLVTGSKAGSSSIAYVPDERRIEVMNGDRERVDVGGVHVVRPIKRKTMKHFWLMQGWYVVKDGTVALRSADWRNPEARREAVRFLVDEVLEVEPRMIKTGDFGNNMLRQLLNKYFGHSAYKAIDFAFPELGIKPWEMPYVRAPANTFADQEARRDAYVWLERMAGKDWSRITAKDFQEWGLWGPFVRYWGSSPFKAACEAHPELDVQRDKMERQPRGYRADAEGNREKIRRMVERSGKDPRLITKYDFHSYGEGLGTIFVHDYNGSAFRALLDAGLVSESDRSIMSIPGPASRRLAALKRAA